MKITDKKLNGLIVLLILLQVMLFADISQAFVLLSTAPEKWSNSTIDGNQ